MTRTYSVRLDVDAPHAAGDLTVSGFATARTAEEVGAVLAKALTEHFGPGTRVDITWPERIPS